MYFKYTLQPQFANIIAIQTFTLKLGEMEEENTEQTVLVHSSKHSPDPPGFLDVSFGISSSAPAQWVSNGY